MIAPFSEARISGYCTTADMERFRPIHSVLKLELRAGFGIASRWMRDRQVRTARAAASVCLQDLCRMLQETHNLSSAMFNRVTNGGRPRSRMIAPIQNHNILGECPT